MANTLKFGNGQWATKVGLTLAYNDENGNFKPLPFNFTRSTSATRVNKDGLIEVVTNNKPRIDFLNDSNGALLLEPSRSNSLTYSEELDNAVWTTLDNVSVSANVATSPDGTMSADKLVENTANAQHRIYRSFTGTGATFSFFAKAAGRSWVCVLSNNGSFSFFNIANGTLGTIQAESTATITDYGNGWYRCTLYNSHISFGALIQLTTANNVTSYLGDGTSGAFIWGCQFEASASYATSYIPTQGAISTRVVDACNNGGNDQVFNVLEGTMFLDCDFINNSAIQVLCSIHDNSASKRLEIFSSSNVINGFIGAGSNITVGSSALTNGRHKIALAYKSGDSSFYIDGVLIGSSSSSFTISALTELSLGYFSGTQLWSECKTNDVQVYNTRLSNAELQQLTTL